MNTSGTTYSVLRLALLIASFAIADRANAACAVTEMPLLPQ